ncbi:MAG: bifunctional riboflavin kinase/FAD synthetase [Campylobacteraceae bacterium]
MSNFDRKNVTSLSLGVFDGIHRGHKELFKKLDKNGAILIIENSRATLTPFKKREEFVGLPCFYYNLDEIKSLDGKAFVEKLISDFPNLEKIVVGYDFRFGFNRSSDVNDLKKLFKKDVVIVDEFNFDGEVVHSTKIRELLNAGDIKKANALLGRNYSICGVVIKGQGLGKKSLYPTINLHVKDYLIPKDGIYASVTKIKNKTYKSVSFIGNRLSTDKEFSIETFLLDVDEVDVKHGDEVEISLVDFIRENRKFDDLNELKNAISKDIQKAKEILK